MRNENSHRLKSRVFLLRNNIEIVPTILSTSKEDFEKNFHKLIQNPNLSGWIHIDLADGEFVNNKTVGLEVINKIEFSQNIEIHLMVKSPMEWIKNIESSSIKRVIFHIESDDVEKSIEWAKEIGLLVGLAINPQTELSQLSPFIDKIDLILIMGVNPGFQGQEFLPSSLEKIKASVKLYPEKIIGEDGGINDRNIKLVAATGASHIAVGSFLTHGDINENLERLWKALRS